MSGLCCFCNNRTGTIMLAALGLIGGLLQLLSSNKKNFMIPWLVASGIAIVYYPIVIILGLISIEASKKNMINMGRDKSDFINDLVAITMIWTFTVYCFMVVSRFYKELGLRIISPA